MAVAKYCSWAVRRGSIVCWNYPREILLPGRSSSEPKLHIYARVVIFRIDQVVIFHNVCMRCEKEVDRWAYGVIGTDGTGFVDVGGSLRLRKSMHGCL